MLWAVLLLYLVLIGGLTALTTLPLPGKIGAVAQAAYREAVRQPLFWFLLLFALAFMLLAVFLPYFTLGEDLKMMKELQLDAILLPALILTVFTASISIAEEIEGRTAVTLLSKPVSRRQFLLGKFLGILLAALLMTAILSLFMGWTITFKVFIWERDIDKKFPDDLPLLVHQTLNALPDWGPNFRNGLAYVLDVAYQLQTMGPGVLLNFCQVMILTAVAVALATRLPMLPNLVTCLVVFFMGRLAHVLEAQSGGNALVKFVAQVFGSVLPGLNTLDVGAPVVSDVPVPWGAYVLPAAGQAVTFTAIALLVGLLLFEDRDVA